MNKILLSKKEAADALGISLRTVDYLIAAKQLDVVRIGKRVLVPKQVLEQFAQHG